MYDENSNAAAASSMTLVALNNAAAAAAAATSSAANNPAGASQLMSQLLNVKDSRWLQLEVCREFQRGQCSRSDLECKFAHPPSHVEIQNGRVTACYDSIKGRCTRENPRCKYLHPPNHLKDILLINGRNNLAYKNLLCSQLGQPPAANLAPLAQLVQPQAQPQTLMPALPFQYFSQLPGFYPALISDPYQQMQQQQQQTATNGGMQSLKRSDKNATVVTTSGGGQLNLYGAQAATAAAAAAAAAQFNPYLLQQPLSYMPATTFTGQLPPRY